MSRKAGTTERLRDIVETTTNHGSIDKFARDLLCQEHDKAVDNFLPVYREVLQTLETDARKYLADALKAEAEILFGHAAL